MPNLPLVLHHRAQTQKEGREWKELASSIHDSCEEDIRRSRQHAWRASNAVLMLI